MSQAPARNALTRETSPYLLQHAGNPVDWHPWGPEALARARNEDKPVLLSIGYSACHWCHVMAHESFEDDETARVMNENFVNIKVDREERPDLDKIYQLAHQLLTHRPGGWPLTMFLTPDDLTPFFGGTYFPVEARFGMPAFKDLLHRVAEVYSERHEDIKRQNESLVRALESLEPEAEGDERITALPIEAACTELRRNFDERHGGFGGAPKFPHPTNIELLLRRYAASTCAGKPDDGALHMAVHTLRCMASAGVYDQLGGGFCRYSVDDRWMIPHFEKMLYDNGPLLGLCAEAWQITGDELFRRVALETGEWVLREMQAPEGGYYSTLDADSEGEEGRFYVWDRDEVRELLEEDEYGVFARRFGLDRPPNFENRAWHLHVHADLAQVAKAVGLDEAPVRERLDSARRKLFAEREKRVHPGRDEKVLTSWNGLMIRGMATAGRILGEPRFVESARRALDFVRAKLSHDGRLLATAKDGRAHLSAYLDDYAFLAQGILSLTEAGWRDGDLEFALELAEVLLAHFEDRHNGGFYFTADDHESLMYRPKSFMDDALPAGNGVAAMVLGRLGHLLGETRYLEAAERTLRAAWPVLGGAPHAHAALLMALEEHLAPLETVVLRGRGDALDAWRDRSQRCYAPRRMTLAIPASAQSVPGLLAEREPRGEVVAWRCEGHTCGPPVTDLAELAAVLGGNEVARE